MPITIKQNLMKYKSDRLHKYVGINSVAERATANQIEDIEAAGADTIAGVNAAIAAGQTAIDGIEAQKNQMISAIASVAGYGTDKTLSTTDVAADAKVTGDEISDLKSAFDILNAEVGMYESNPIVVPSGSSHSANDDRINVNIKANEKIYVKVDTNDNTDAISVKVYGYGASTQSLFEGNTNKGYEVRPKTVTNNITTIGLYVAAQNKNVTYKVYIKCESSYLYKIDENTKGRKMLRDNLKHSDTGEIDFFAFTDFTNGAIDSGEVKNRDYNRVSSVDIITITDALTVRIANGFKIGFNYFVSGAYSSDSGWQTGTYTIPAGSSFMCMIARTSEISEIADIPTFVKQITFDTNYKTNIEKQFASEDTRFTVLEGKMAINPDNFELGNMGINANGWTYSNSSQRVRTKASYDLELDVGDIIRLKDYTKASAYIGYQVKNAETSGYGSDSWISEDYVCKYGGKYCILIKEMPSEKTQADTSYLLGMLEIIKYNNTANQTKILKAITNARIESVNHRGLNRTAPENTLPAFKLSKVYGFDFAETDISFTSDGVAVCLHDSTINRTARNSDGTEISGDVYINNITYEEALEYDFGIYKATRWAGTKIPTFEQFVKLAKQIGIGIFAELKSAGATTALIKGLVDIAKAYGMEKKIVWIGFDTGYLGAIHEKDPYARIGLLANSITDTIISNALALKGEHNEVFINSGSSTDTEVNKCKAAGIPLGRYTMNTEASILALPDYVTSITSDFLNGTVVNYEDAMK